MDAELTGTLAAASTEAENRLGEPFTGPDGVTYIGVFQAPDAFQIAATGIDMQAHGFPDRTIIALICTIGQFAVPPLSWRRHKSKLIRTGVNPAQHLTVAHFTADSPLHYGFVLTNFQPAG